MDRAGALGPTQNADRQSRPWQYKPPPCSSQEPSVKCRVSASLSNSVSTALSSASMAASRSCVTSGPISSLPLAGAVTGYVALHGPARLRRPGGGWSPKGLSDRGAGAWRTRRRAAARLAWVGVPRRHMSGPSVAGLSGWPARLQRISHRLAGLGWLQSSRRPALARRPGSGS